MMRFNLSEWAITHRALVLFMIIVLGGAGAYSYLNLGRAEDPSFTIKTMIVAATWPGATATEMQTQVTDRIEKKLQELPFLDRVESCSQPGMSFIQVFLLDRTPPAKVKELWYQVRKKVGDIRGDLPAGVIGPSFNDEYGDVYSALYMLTADGMSLAELKTRSEDIRQQLLRVPNVNKVDIIGERPQKIFVEINHAKLATLGITPQQIFDSVARQNAVTSGGSVDTAADRINLRVTGAFSGAEAIAAVPVEAGGRTFRLGDIATVTRGYEDPATFLVREGGKPALGLGVSMQDGVNIIKLGEDLKVAMEAITQTLPVGIEVTQIADQANVVEHSVSEFIETFLEALAIVLLVSFISLGWRAGIVVALCVPAGARDRPHDHVRARHRPSSHHPRRADHRARAAGRRRDHRHRDDGGEDGGGLGSRPRRDLRLDLDRFPDAHRYPGTVAGFLPVGFAKSSAGEYAGGIFWIVGIALIASWVVAVLFTPYLGLMLLPDMAKSGKHGGAAHGDESGLRRSRIYRALGRVIEFALAWRKTVVAVTALMFVAAVAGFGLVQQQFFPTSSRTELFFELRLPEGTAIGVTDAAAKKAESMLVGDSDIVTYTTYVGQGAPRFWLGLNPVLPNRTSHRS